jgi:hypothetical protein
MIFVAVVRVPPSQYIKPSDSAAAARDQGLTIVHVCICLT